MEESMKTRVRRCAALAVALAGTLGGMACSRDAEVLAVARELDTFSSDLVSRVTTAPSPAQGVDAAQKYLDENRARLRERLQAVKTVRGFQVSEETRRKLEASFAGDAAAVAGLELRYGSQAAMDPGFRARMEKLVADYKSVVTD